MRDETEAFEMQLEEKREREREKGIRERNSERK